MAARLFDQNNELSPLIAAFESLVGSALDGIEHRPMTTISPSPRYSEEKGAGDEELNRV